MATRDLKNRIDVKTTLAPAAHTATGNGSSVAIGEAEAASIEAIVGTITDGTHSLVVQEAPDDGTGNPGTFATVAAGDLDGAFANLASNVNQQVGYRGGKPFVRANKTVSGATVGGVYGVVIVRGSAKKLPI